ncbi:MAG TPA: excinuclease ABC subunit UvrC [Patescibacteria group bacterium]|nr:excinuclease ABC subunit UvrC [Patescibacteria group bacterium]
MTNKRLEKRLAELPTSPGVYFHKDAAGEIIYIGKAANLRNRVRQYFQASRTRDPKTDLLVAEISDFDWQVVDSELDALFLEAELVRRYLPRYNILLRDDKSMVYIRIDYDSDYPTVSTTRRPLDDKARYFGPYLSAQTVRTALKLLRRAFPYATRRIASQKRASLHYHLGLDPGLEEGKTSIEEYRANLRRLMAYIQGKRGSIISELEKDMKRYAKSSEFEKAAKVRNQLFALQNLGKQVVFSDKEFLEISKDHALNELVDLLGLQKFPARIEGYDISHMGGMDVVASMVVFTNGASNKSEYRKFKTRINKNDDFYNMNETIARRLSERNRKKWGLPSLVLIDGGKGQLDAAIRARDEARQGKIPFIGLAKREEQIVIHKGKSQVVLNVEVLHRLGGFISETGDFMLVNVPHSTNLVKLLQRIRDESHRFAVSYHSTLKVKRQTSSLLDDIPGIGPATRKKLIKTFGSLRGVSSASQDDLAKTVGSTKAKTILAQLTGK